MSYLSNEENARNFLLSVMLETPKIIAEMEEDGEDEGTSQSRTRAAALNRDREGAHERLVGDYFAENCVYIDEQFRRRFRMSRRLFVRIANDLANYDKFFTLRYDARGRRGFTTFQKCTSALCQLAYGIASNSWDKYLSMSTRMNRECLYEFSKGIVNMYSTVYLRRPTKKDIEKLFAFHQERHGFPRMLGSIGCTHWQWHNFPTAWCGQFMRDDKGSNNNLNVLARVEIFDEIIRGMGPDSSFILNGVSYKHGYYLADGIYPSYMAIVKTIPKPSDKKRNVRKDVKRLFGMIKAKWGIIQQPARAYEPEI